MKGHALAIRRLAIRSAVAAAIGVLVAVMTVAPVARADVDPYGPNSRFISLVKHAHCGTAGYTAEGYMVDDSGNRIPNSTWHRWDGNVRGCSGKAVFAWEPTNDQALIDFAVYGGSDLVRFATVRGDMNYCLLFDASGKWEENSSSGGGGGSGACTAD